MKNLYKIELDYAKNLAEKYILQIVPFLDKNVWPKGGKNSSMKSD